MATRRGWLRALGRLAGGALCGLGLVFVVATLTPLVSWWGRQLAGPWDDPRGEVLIVLGASTLEDGTLGVDSYWRAVYAKLVYHEGGVRQVLVSGGGGVAVALKDFIQCQGVPPEVIRLEASSTSTRENALYSRDLLAGVSGRPVLLTSDYHMYRAHRAFRKAGLEVLPRPFPDAIKRASFWRSRWPAFLDLVLETGKIGYYRLRGWI